MAKVEEKIGDLQKWKRFCEGGRRKIAKVEEKVCALQKRQRFCKSGIECKFYKHITQITEFIEATVSPFSYPRCV